MVIKKELISDSTNFIDIYYDKKSSSNFNLKNIYIIIGNYCFSCSFNYNKVITLYNKYQDEEDNDSKFCDGGRLPSLLLKNKNEVIELIESSLNGYLRIWNFHSAELLNKINVINSGRLYSVC